MAQTEEDMETQIPLAEIRIEIQEAVAARVEGAPEEEDVPGEPASEEEGCTEEDSEERRLIHAPSPLQRIDTGPAAATRAAAHTHQGLSKENVVPLHKALRPKWSRKPGVPSQRDSSTAGALSEIDSRLYLRRDSNTMAASSSVSSHLYSLAGRVMNRGQLNRAYGGGRPEFLTPLGVALGLGQDLSEDDLEA